MCFYFLCVCFKHYAYGMYVSFLIFVLGYGQLLALDESLTVLLAVS